MIIVGVHLPLLSSRHRRCMRARSRWPRFSHMRRLCAHPSRVLCAHTPVDAPAGSRHYCTRLPRCLCTYRRLPTVDMCFVPPRSFRFVFRVTVSYIFSTSGTARRFWNRMRLQNMHVVLERSVVREPLAGTGTPQRYWDRPGGAGTPRWYWDRPGVLGRRVVLGRWWYWEGVFQYHRAVPVPSAYQNLDWVRGRGGKVPDE